ncbi:MAG: 30S ribosomal protein S5 [Phycisphaerae bacterium]|nr:30S ribosomal protein S5 [Phycisphaerae bacterium]
MAQFAARNEREESPVEDQLVKIYRCSKVVKGGRNFSFAGLVVVGDRKGQVGYGYGKANEVPQAVEKANKEARRSLVSVNLKGTTIPHQVSGRFGATKITLIPASVGTGVIAGVSARSVLELAGIQDVLTKIYGSTSPKNVVKATMNALKLLKSREQIEKLRGVKLS